MEGPEYRSDRREPGLIDSGGDPEIGELDRTVVSEQDVGRFDVAVNDPAAVDGVKRSGHAVDHVQRLCNGKGRAAIQRIAQGLALDVLHDDHLLVTLACYHVIDGYEVGMAQRGADKRFTTHALSLSSVPTDAFERNQTAESGVLGEDNGRHGA